MAVVRGTGNLRVPVFVACSGALILVPLSPTLIFGAFGLPLETTVFGLQVAAKAGASLQSLRDTAAFAIASLRNK
jgi:Na+-driven multidrug efflux pump